MAPSINLKEETRQALFEQAVKLVRHVGYRNAGACSGVGWNEREGGQVGVLQKEAYQR